MALPGRNDPCPCGSGSKYKKCCLGRIAAPVRTPPPPSPPNKRGPLLFLHDDGLDRLSNSVIDLVKAGRFDDALAVCQRLLTEFPDVVDGRERSGLVHAARGDHTAAAHWYREALTFVTDPCRCHDYDDADFYRQQSEHQERLAQSARSD